ncbi:Bor/Iss family lipoprotein [Gemmatimonadota bacterium]
MKKKQMLGVLMLFCMFLTVGCAAHVHTIGTGPSPTADTEEVRQWYWLWGMIPMNEVDTNEMAAGAENYEITTEFTALDCLINIFTSLVSIQSRTVTIKKLPN